jgi:hypothetical protein
MTEKSEKDKKVVDALLADRIGIEGAEAAYAELKDQICAIGARYQLTLNVMATAMLRVAFIMAVHLPDTPEDGIAWMRKSIDTLEDESEF